MCHPDKKSARRRYEIIFSKSLHPRPGMSIAGLQVWILFVEVMSLYICWASVPFLTTIKPHYPGKGEKAWPKCVIDHSIPLLTAQLLAKVCDWPFNPTPSCPTVTIVT